LYPSLGRLTNYKIGIDTRICSSCGKEKETMISTVTISLVKPWNLKAGDKLEWVTKTFDDEVETKTT